MGMDLDKMKDKLAEIRGESSGSEDIFWKPDKNSDHRIRVVLPQDGTGDPFKEYAIHYDVEDAPFFLCPRQNYDEECPVCEFASEMWEEGERLDSSEHRNLAKDLWPDQRFYSAIIERDPSDMSIKEGPAWYGYSKTVYEAFLGYAVDPDYDDFTDPEEGRDVKLSYTQGENEKFPSTDIKLAPNPSPLAPSEEERQEIFESIPDLEEGQNRLDQEEIQEYLDGHIEKNYKSEAEGEEIEKFGGGEDESDEVEEALKEIAE